MRAEQRIIYLLDDDQRIIKALTRLLKTQNFDVRSFTSVTEFLKAFEPSPHACLILDVAMPELNGMQLQQKLADERVEVAIVFLSGHGDIPMSVRAIKNGAVDFLTKPVDADALFEAIDKALEFAQQRHANLAAESQWAALYANLTPREKEVMAHVVTGQLNKQIAGDLGIVEQTIKVHRARVMQKMGVVSVAELVRIADSLAKTQSPHSSPGIG